MAVHYICDWEGIIFHSIRLAVPGTQTTTKEKSKLKIGGHFPSPFGTATTLIANKIGWLQFGCMSCISMRHIMYGIAEIIDNVQNYQNVRNPTKNRSTFSLDWLHVRADRIGSDGVFTRSNKRPANVQLHYNIWQQTSSNSRVFWIHLLEVCWTFAGSCKHSISQWHWWTVARSESEMSDVVRVLNSGHLGVYKYGQKFYPVRSNFKTWASRRRN